MPLWGVHVFYLLVTGRVLSNIFWETKVWNFPEKFTDVERDEAVRMKIKGRTAF